MILLCVFLSVQDANDLTSNGFFRRRLFFFMVWSKPLSSYMKLVIKVGAFHTSISILDTLVTVQSTYVRGLLYCAVVNPVGYGICTWEVDLFPQQCGQYPFGCILHLRSPISWKLSVSMYVETFSATSAVTHTVRCSTCHTAEQFSAQPGACQSCWMHSGIPAFSKLVNAFRVVEYLYSCTVLYGNYRRFG